MTDEMKKLFRDIEPWDVTEWLEMCGFTVEDDVARYVGEDGKEIVLAVPQDSFDDAFAERVDEIVKCVTSEVGLVAIIALVLILQRGFVKKIPCDDCGGVDE